MSEPQTQTNASGHTAAPATVDTVTLTIDGRQVTVPKGTNVLEAAKGLDVDISAFCYHPGLSIAAVCRQCLVSIENVPKVQPSCQTIAADGMVVHTKDQRSTLARKQMLEFTLVNHPVDCPICDKAGECTLQKLYFEHDNAPSRLDVPKVHKPKAVDLGPHIVLDAERCILCTRCIRVCDEVAGEHQLEMHQRGDHQELGTAPGAALDNAYSLNTVDVCPVGALTSKDFRFTMRAWELFTTPSVCNGCATGCNIEVQHKNERVWRLIPRLNSQVNKYWMCDEGRFTYHELREQRLAAPLHDGLPTSWERALRASADKLEAVLRTARGSVGVVLSAQHTNEDNYVLYKLARDIWQLDNIYLGGKAPAPERADDILRDADVNPNTAGARAIAAGRELGNVAALERDLTEGKLRALVVLGHELPLSGQALARARELDALIVIAWREVGIAAAAHVALACSAWAEVHGTITNRKGIVQRMHAACSPTGQSLPAWEIVTRLAQACGATLSYSHPKKVFEEMLGKVNAFAGADWGKPARPLQLRFAGSRG
jgi:NADH-quinone oxidoreductase subunit G